MKLPLKADIFKQIVSGTSEGIAFVNRSGRLIYFNKAFLVITGLDKKTLSDKKFNFDTEFLPSLSSDNGITYTSDGIKLEKYFLNNDGYYLVKIIKEDVFEDKYSLYENLLDPITIVDKKGHFVFLNTNFKKIFKLDLFENKPAFQHYLINKDVWKKIILSLNHTDSLKSYELEVKLSDDSVKYFNCNCTKTEDDENIILHLRDISTEKSLRVQNRISELNYNRLFEIINSSIVIVDELGSIINMNKSAEELYGYSREEIRLKQYDKFFRVGRNRPSIKEIIESTKSNGGRYIEIGVSRRNKEGAFIYTYTTYSLLEFGQEGAFVLFVMEKDLTPRIKLEKQLKNTVVQVKETQAAAIIGFAKLTEYRDHITGAHLERIREYTRYLAKALKKNNKYKDYINDEYIEDLALSSVLHDIGKVGIEDSILLKAGKLSEEEFQRMKEHSVMGGDALKSIDNELGHQSFLTLGREVAQYHHERWDGSGYPEGLKGSDIPLSARIISIADVYDALTSERPYKSAFSHEDALKIIIKERGCQFDPELVDTFIEIEQKVKRIREIIE